MNINVLYMDGTENTFEGVTEFYNSVEFDGFIELRMDDFSSALIRTELIVELLVEAEDEDIDTNDDFEVVETHIYYSGENLNTENASAEYGLDD